MSGMAMAELSNIGAPIIDGNLLHCRDLEAFL